MLVSLHVKNLALMEEAEVEFGSGLNILSGETGAGKSIIIGSINLALGEKAPKEMLREHAEYALVELIFRVDNEEQRKLLAEMDIFPENDEIIMSRKITSSRSVGKINSETVSASCMKKAASYLIDIHGQHEHQSLLHKRKHLEILDEYGKEQLEGKKKTLKQRFQEYQEILEEKQRALLEGEGRERELAFLEYEIQEIEDTNLIMGEDEELEVAYRKMANNRKIMEAAGMAYEMTGGSSSATEQLGRALRELQTVADYDEKLEGFCSQLEEVDSLLNDFNRELSGYISEEEFDGEAFAEVERRLDEINRLKDKFGGSVEAVLNAKEEKQKKYSRLKDYEEYLEQLEKRLSKSERAMQKISDDVSKIRKKYAKKLTKQVQGALVDLNFLDVNFTMEFQETKGYTANGKDEAEFLISTNPGEPLKPLGKVASGGELSRIMLAIKTILAESDQIETLIFDEIDAGISGRTAQMVAEKMNVIGRSHQVLCITHLPQIAAMADYHFLISKNVVNNVTVSSICLLEEKESITELGRMLGGVKITDTVMESAREMKELAITAKKSQS
ncbi:DNA repair protein RecN [Petralouisia muris]|uniref:DNA repair protein RecN n=1 Tax=Petralouisia muris TaxID=3032872 RepID=A0AC61RUT3_9FIRM|nr:DNA repair protein RecN [Petralouisia muris]TGY95463.1 DNA repair protein RecN [Petralouisia muris]